MKLFKNFEEVIECYGADALIPVTNLKQIIYYAKAFRLQPKWIDESKEREGCIVAYYLKAESNIAYKKWIENRPLK